jgi:hypothetical protein
VEHAASEPLLRQFPEPAFHQIQPRGTGRGEVQLKARMLAQPPFYVRMFVGPVVVQDQVQGDLLGELAIQLAKEL